ncbi:hypothetical protein BDP27DRAFT_1333892 [Rhodocollybia butyracea]|uniref:Uncharacterized protein n=1 Tax=Rhodocollybia butyracea TaxID=206335 RepID=A0A9P5U2T2_9AGAR|nr:hypothetical protein BDP27DRAFT_1333892 [Rhodocollybia butyracea]
MSISILESGLYTITSLSGEVTRTPEGTYRLSTLGYAYTGAGSGLGPEEVFVTINEEQNREWIFTSFQNQGRDLYAIELADRSKAWTTENPNPEEQSRINTEPLRTTKSLPPQATPPQLFQVRRVLMD